MQVQLKNCEKVAYGLVISTILLPSVAIASAGAIVVQCFEPAGIMIDAQSGSFEQSQDKYSNSNPTFLYSQTNPNVILETWQSSNPYADLMTREEVDRISPPSTIESQIVSAGNGIIHAISFDQTSGEAYSTTLYVEDNQAVFTRVKTDTAGVVTGFPMGAVYVAECESRLVE